MINTIKHLDYKTIADVHDKMYEYYKYYYDKYNTTHKQ